jgi:NADH:ubiquinone oxidoreductase subunit 2 (subunit N)
LSMAGVPPLLGFFSKIFIFVLVAHSNLFVLFLPLFILLFVGLYFYVQNLRFLNSTNKPQLVLPSELSLRSNFSYYTTSLPLLFLVIFGFCYVDDLLLLSAWVLL